MLAGIETLAAAGYTVQFHPTPQPEEREHYTITHPIAVAATILDETTGGTMTATGTDAAAAFRAARVLLARRTLSRLDAEDDTAGDPLPEVDDRRSTVVSDYGAFDRQAGGSWQYTPWDQPGAPIPRGYLGPAVAIDEATGYVRPVPMTDPARVGYIYTPSGEWAEDSDRPVGRRITVRRVEDDDGPGPAPGTRLPHGMYQVVAPEEYHADARRDLGTLDQELDTPAEAVTSIIDPDAEGNADLAARIGGDYRETPAPDPDDGRPPGAKHADDNA
jgi:hypothetical protein